MRRYERKGAGELLHLDTKTLARFEQPGQRVTGDRTRYSAKAGWQVLHVAIDDHLREGFSLMPPDETAHSAWRAPAGSAALLQRPWRAN